MRGVPLVKLAVRSTGSRPVHRQLDIARRVSRHCALAKLDILFGDTADGLKHNRVVRTQQTNGERIRLLVAATNHWTR